MFGLFKKSPSVLTEIRAEFMVYQDGARHVCRQTVFVAGTSEQDCIENFRIRMKKIKADHVDIIDSEVMADSEFNHKDGSYFII